MNGGALTAKEALNITRVIDTAFQLAILTKIVDTDTKGLFLSITL